jgi:hypothetical protein
VERLRDEEEHERQQPEQGKGPRTDDAPQSCLRSCGSLRQLVLHALI